MSIRVDDLAGAIAEELAAYREEVKEDLFTSIDEAADLAVATLRATSPKDSGDYRKGWRKKKAYESSRDLRMQVYNKTDYQLTHLLEEGHAKVNGGFVEGQPHIGPAAEQAAEALEKDVTIKVGR